MIYTQSQLAGKELTVLGPVSSDQLGPTVTHEHCLVDMTSNFVAFKGASDRQIAHEPVTFQNVGVVLYGTGIDILIRF